MRYLILGGTGSLGRALIKELLGRDKNPTIHVFSRDELKQKRLLADFPKVKCTLGDIRDRSALDLAMQGMDVVFHVAALKHIDILEQNPTESVKTNILGSINVADAAIQAGVWHVAFSSTDKAIEPINVYGMSKAIAAKHYQNLNERNIFTKFSVFTWGNVAGSRGSVIPIFVDTLKKNKTVHITDMEMTRFWIKIEDAAKFMVDNYSTTGVNLIPDMKAAAVTRVADTIANILNIGDYKTVITGMRPGEKIHEMISPTIASNTAAQFTDSELREFLYPLVKAIA